MSMRTDRANAARSAARQVAAMTIALGMTVLLILYPELPTNRLAGSDIAHAVPSR